MPIPVSPISAATSDRTSNRLAGGSKLDFAPVLDDTKADVPGRLTIGAWWAGRDASPGLSPGPDRGLWIKVGVAVDIEFEVVIGVGVEFVPSTAKVGSKFDFQVASV
jgi:hypothetical protein